jgi:hypothetical protein
MPQFSKLANLSGSLGASVFIMLLMSWLTVLTCVAGVAAQGGLAWPPPHPTLPPPAPTPFNCSVFNCTCQGFADYYGTHAGHGFGCAPSDAQVWWKQHKCQANAHCLCCKGPACSLPDPSPCICPAPTPPTPPTPPPPPLRCPAPIIPSYVCKSCHTTHFSWDTLPGEWAPSVAIDPKSMCIH